MKKYFLTAVAAMICCFLAYQTSFAQKKEKDKLLAGKTFTIELTETEGKKPKTESDEIAFKGEKLSSKFMAAEHKFPAASYTASADSSEAGKEISFTAECTTTDKKNVLKWEGIVTGEEIEGTVLWESKGKKKKEYTFTGTLKAKKK
jgi:hypothetical protein